MSDPDVKWLDDDQQRAWRAYVRGTRALEATLDNEIRAAAGISISEFELLSILSEATDRTMRMSALAEIVVQSRSRVSHTASRLERRGWVVRRPSTDDGRGVELRLADSGFEAIEKAARSHVMTVRDHLVDVLTRSEMTRLGETMEKVARANRTPSGHAH